MSILCEVIVSVIICISVLFGKVCKMELFHCTVAKLLLKCNYVLFLISVFIVQVTKLVQFTQYNTFSKNFTINSRALCNSCEDMASCWFEGKLTFFNANYEMEQFFSSIHFCSVYFTFHPAP